MRSRMVAVSHRLCAKLRNRHPEGWHRIVTPVIVSSFLRLPGTIGSTYSEDKVKTYVVQSFAALRLRQGTVR